MILLSFKGELHYIPIELHFIVLYSLALAILSFWSGWRETKPSYYYFGKSNSSREISVYIHHHSISISYRSKRWNMSSVIWIVKILQKEFCLPKQLKIAFVNYNSASKGKLERLREEQLSKKCWENFWEEMQVYGEPTDLLSCLQHIQIHLSIQKNGNSC